MLPVAERDLAACAANVELGQSIGVDSRLLEPEAVAEVEPALRTAASPPPRTSLTADSSIRDA